MGRRKPAEATATAVEDDLQVQQQTSRRSARVAVQQQQRTTEPEYDESMEVDQEEPETNEDTTPLPLQQKNAKRKKIVAPEPSDSEDKEDGAAEASEESPVTKDAEVKKVKKAPIYTDIDSFLSVEDMVQNCILYLFLIQHKMIPAKKASIIKHAMNGQARDFEEVMNSLKTVFDEIYGLQLVGVGETQKSGLHSNYIIMSNYNLSVCDMVTTRDHDVDCRRSILFLILTLIFMMGRSINEVLIWKMLEDTKLNTLVCDKRDNLKRFLRQEYVSSMYLIAEENDDSDPPVCRYSWGLRADKEFSKYSILKFVAKQFPGKKPIDFMIQYGIAKELEGDLVAADAVIEEREAAENVENVPPQTEEIERHFLTVDEENALLECTRHFSDSDEEPAAAAAADASASDAAAVETTKMDTDSTHEEEEDAEEAEDDDEDDDEEEDDSDSS